MPKLNQKEIDQLNRPITRNEVEYDIKTLPKNKSLGPDGLKQIVSNIKRRIIPILLKVFQKVEKEGTLSKTFNDTIIALIPTPGKDTTKKKTISQYF